MVLRLLESIEALGELIPQVLFHGLINGHRVDGDADGQKGGHLVRLLHNVITQILSLRNEATHAGYVAQGVGECANSILETTHHHVGETDIVACCDVTRRHLVVHLL